MVFPNVIETVGQVAIEAFLAKFAILSILPSDLDQQGFVLKFNANPLRKIGERGFGNFLLVGVIHDHGQGNEVALDPDEGELSLEFGFDQIDALGREAVFLPQLRNAGLQLATEYPIGQGNDIGRIR